MEKGWKMYEPLPQTKEEEKLWKQFVPLWEQWKGLHNQIITLTKSGKRDEAMALSTGKAREEFNATAKLLNELVTLNENVAAEEHKAANRAAASVKTILIVVALIGVILAIGLGIIISRMITRPIQKAAEMIQEMAMGHLGVRLKMDQKDEIGIMATTMDHFADDLQNTVVGSMQKIATGDVSMEISAKDDKDEINPALKKIIESLRGLVAEAGMLAKAAVEGKLATRGNAEKFNGSYRDIVQGVNDTLDAVIGPLNVAAEYVDRISKGDTPQRITDEYKGDFNEIKNNLNQCIDAVNMLVADAGMLAKAAVEGKLATRADASKHGGDFQKIVSGVNETLDAVIGPLNVAAEYVDRIAKGDIPAKISDSYNGDFNEIKNNLNQCIDAVNMLEMPVCLPRRP